MVILRGTYTSKIHSFYFILFIYLFRGRNNLMCDNFIPPYKHNQITPLITSGGERKGLSECFR
jgi:hypothetical protein